jgi:hypothetical protein
MPSLDTAAEVALDEAVGLCEEPAGRHADLIRWLGRHPGLAAELAEHLAASEKLQPGIAARKPDTAARAEETLSYGGDSERTGTNPGAEVLHFGDFEILGELGRGGMGVVYKARHKAMSKIVALKTVLAAGFHSERDVLRLQLEWEAVARLDHPNIVPIFGAGVYEGMPFFSMKYISGGTLADALEERRKDLPTAAALLAKVARAVDYAHHRMVVHRDLKPGNILLENGEPMIADFGLAKTLDVQSPLSGSGAIVGTPSYMSPEQARGDKGLTTATDIYSLGAIAYQLLTGRPPFRGETVYETLRMVIDQAPTAPKDLNPSAPPDLEAVCMKCLEKNPANRYPSAAALGRDLERFSEGLSVSVRPQPVLSQVIRTIRGKRDTGPTNESWGTFTLKALGIAGAAHTAIFGLVLGGAGMGWVWAVLAAFFVVTGIARTRQILRSRAFFPWERHMVGLWAGYTVCALGLALALLPFDPNAPADRALAWYPPLAVLLALAVFVQASISTGLNYPAGFIYLAVAVALRYCGPAAPLVFVAFHAIMQVILLWNAFRDKTYAPIPEASKPA